MKRDNFGYIYLHKKFLSWQWKDDPAMVALFIHLLLTANWQDKQFKGRIIKRGQVVVGRISLAEKVGISQQKVRSAITRLKSTNEITSESTNEFTVLTIVKYEEYQKKPNKSTSKSTSKSANEQPTINHDLNNNINNTNSAELSASADLEVFNQGAWLKGLLDSERKDLKIVGWYIHRKGVKLGSKEQAEATLRRNVKPAGELKPWSSGQLDSCMSWLEDNGLSWTLETISKHIAEQAEYTADTGESDWSDAGARL